MSSHSATSHHSVNRLNLLLSIQPRTSVFIRYNALFLLNLRSPSNSNIESTLILGFIFLNVCYNWPFEICVLCKEYILLSLLMLCLVSSNCVVLCGDEIILKCSSRLLLYCYRYYHYFQHQQLADIFSVELWKGASKPEAEQACTHTHTYAQTTRKHNAPSCIYCMRRGKKTLP